MKYMLNKLFYHILYTASAFTFTHVTPLKIVIFFKVLPPVYEGVVKDRGYLDS